MNYLNGRRIRKGDLCWHAERRQIAQVAEIIESLAAQEKYHESESGLFLCQDLSLRKPKIELFIAQRFFEEEEIEPLTDEERGLVESLLKLAGREAKKRFRHRVAYRAGCLDNPLENRPPRSREWTVNLYDPDNLSGTNYLVSDDFSELRQLRT